MKLEELYKIIIDRRLEKPKKSYTAFLFNKGSNLIIQKVGEEAAEVIIAAKNEGKKRIISEVADLLFHVLVMLAAFDISLKDISLELDKRNK